jgi:hypothetical protein
MEQLTLRQEVDLLARGMVALIKTRDEDNEGIFKVLDSFKGIITKFTKDIKDREAKVTYITNAYEVVQSDLKAQEVELHEAFRFISMKAAEIEKIHARLAALESCKQSEIGDRK